jgi:hypothetical protein
MSRKLPSPCIGLTWLSKVIDATGRSSVCGLWTVHGGYQTANDEQVRYSVPRRTRMRRQRGLESLQVENRID